MNKAALLTLPMHKMNQTMQGKKIMVVGATSGIGKALTEKLTVEGASVYAVSRTEDGTNPGIIDYAAIDIVNEDIPAEIIPDTLDGLVYCPGSIVLKPFRSLSEEQFRADYDINVMGAVRAIKATLKALKKSEQPASVVLFSTVAVQQGMPFHASIAAAKGALEGLTRSLAAELAPHIRVNCVAPSLTDTPLASKILSSPERIDASNQRHPLKRIGTSADVANTAYFLLSDDSSWMTGQILGVDGGMSSLRP